MTSENAGIDRQSVRPFHEQLTHVLRARVSELGPGGRFPTELSLVSEFGLSRATVRRSLDTLVEEGALARRRGKGTFVRGEPIVHSLDRLRPFVSMFTDAGQQPTGRILAYEWVADTSRMPARVAALGSEALHVRRIYQVDDMGHAIADIFVPADIAADITRRDLEAFPVYQVIEQKLHLSPAYADVAIRSDSATTDTSDLDVEPGAPLLSVERTTFDESGQILECTVLYLRPDAFEFRLRVTASDSGSANYRFPNDVPHLVHLDHEPLRAPETGVQNV